MPFIAGAISIADLQAKGIQLTTGEALAVAQSILETTDDQARPPFRPLSRDNIVICCDGSVASIACAATPTVLEAAILVDELLRDGGSQAPGALRYALARALHEVAAPPFDSLADFSRALRRFEVGGRATIVRALYARAVEPPPMVESGWQMIGLPFAATVLAGVALIGAGEAMHIERSTRAMPVGFTREAIDARPIVLNPPPLVVHAPEATHVSRLATRRDRPAPRRETRPQRQASGSSRALARIVIRFDEL